ncbi:MAG: NAD(P)H-binding protein [Solirubrobacteraceae bacterium]|nr:NAD(P)H-binding protein [Solirubrobacteraceae bacterium]
MSVQVLVTGATGFVGSRLVDRLSRTDGVRVRALVRDPSRADVPEGVDVVAADLDDANTLPPALEGIDVAYYLVHSMGAGGDLVARDTAAARRFVDAARRTGLRRTVYLGAVGYDPDGGSSEHLESRRAAEDVLADGIPELVAVRASMIVGPGSGSFGTLVQMVDRLPVLATAPWRTAGRNRSASTTCSTASSPRARPRRAGTTSPGPTSCRSRSSCARSPTCSAGRSVRSRSR